MKTIHKLKQSTSNFKYHFVRDSKVVVAGTLFMFMVFGVASVSAVKYSIIYDDNVVSDMPVDTAGTTMNDSENISSDKPTRDGYSFLKWCTKVPESDGTCPGTEYSPGAALAISGTSKNEYNLYAMWEEATADYCKSSSYDCMQDLTLATCQTKANGTNLTVTDRRDGSNYTVKYINNECWMTQNLRITGTIPASDSNFDGDDFNVSEYSLASSDSSYSNHCDSTNGYNYACAKDSNSGTTGVWYNYYAASAGTISTNSNSTVATSDICPAGWHLPTGPNTTSGTDYNKLVGNTTSGYQNPTTGFTAFGAVPGGYYVSGSLYDTGLGDWWSATANNTTYRYDLGYDSGHGQFLGDGYYNRYYGYFVRCVRSS